LIRAFESWKPFQNNEVLGYGGGGGRVPSPLADQASLREQGLLFLGPRSGEALGAGRWLRARGARREETV
jgi:hypothetical protein